MFNKNKNNSDGHSNFCRECGKIYNKTYYTNNKRKSHDKRNQYRRKQRRLNKKFVLTFLKEHGCTDCPEKDPIVLEFDHVTGIKTNNICTMIAEGRSLVTLADEIAKCEVRCANCHKRKTAKEQNWCKLDEDYLEK
jgi:hypothetical protein